MKNIALFAIFVFLYFWLLYSCGLTVKVRLWCRTYFASQVHKGKNVAIVGLGRKLLKIIWYLLKEKREYEERPVEKEKFDFPVALSNV